MQSLRLSLFAGTGVSPCLVIRESSRIDQPINRPWQTVVAFMNQPLSLVGPREADRTPVRPAQGGLGMRPMRDPPNASQQLECL